MTGKEWTTPPQKKLLQEELVRYSSMSVKEYKRNLFAEFYEQWLECWPERAAKFPEIPLDAPLTDEQATDVEKAADMRKKVSRITLTLKMHANLQYSHSNSCSGCDGTLNQERLVLPIGRCSTWWMT